MSFFELRIYEVFEGQMEKWIRYFNEEIIPFQTQRGMVIHGAFNVISTDTFSKVNNERVMATEQHPNIFTWIRRFENAAKKEELYKRVYESKEWLDDYKPKISKMINLNTVIVHNLSALDMSVMK